MIPRHVPAFYETLVAFLRITERDIVLDCTLGDGGHTQKALETGAVVVSLDQDPEAITRAKYFIPRTLQRNWYPVNANFADALTVLNNHKFAHPTVIIFDLGVSTFQLANSNRGFSFINNGPLDMRMNPNTPLCASDLVNKLPEVDLARLMWDLSDEVHAKTIARAIVNYRHTTPIQSTRQLAEIVEKIYKNKQGIHPATKTFQALRMAVNHERDSLKNGLQACLSVLVPTGRMGVISFHSGEDRLVKTLFRQWSKKGLVVLTNQKPIAPSEQEKKVNQKIRSAKLRIIEKTNDQNN